MILPQMNPGKSGQVVIPLICIFKYLRPPVTIDWNPTGQWDHQNPWERRKV